jgi:hypothetical protein
MPINDLRFLYTCCIDTDELQWTIEQYAFCLTSWRFLLAHWFSDLDRPTSNLGLTPTKIRIRVRALATSHRVET